MIFKRPEWKRYVAAGLAAGCSVVGPRAATADAVTDWNAIAGAIAVAACISPAPDPFHASRLYGMVRAAIHDAVNAIVAARI